MMTNQKISYTLVMNQLESADSEENLSSVTYNPANLEEVLQKFPSPDFDCEHYVSIWMRCTIIKELTTINKNGIETCKQDILFSSKLEFKHAKDDPKVDTYNRNIDYNNQLKNKTLED